MLLQLREYIKKGKVVSIDQMSREFRVTKDALIPMLDIWVAKGVIRQSQKVACGRKCFSCKPRRPEFYQWI